MAKADQNLDVTFCILAGLTFLLSGFMGFINFHEFVKVGLFKEIADYPFGGEGPVPWYYKSVDLYAKVSLISGLIFLSTFVIAIRITLRRNKKGIGIILLATIFLIVAMLVNGHAD